MKLQELQSNFQTIVLDAECVGADWVSKSAKALSSQDRLAIYHNAYRVRLIDVLLDTFEHTLAYLGDDWFQQLSSSFVQSHHSTHNNIGLYGKAFPQFLAEQLPNDLEVAELALMDWTLRRAFDGANTTVMTQAHLQQLASGELIIDKLHTVPTLSITQQHFNTLDIWQAINQDEHPPLVQKLAEPVDILIWRKGHSPHFRSLSQIESTAINCLYAGSTLDEIGAVLVDQFPDGNTVEELGTMLHRWINDEILKTNL